MSKQNTPGLGIEYEILVPAYFALTLNNDENVEDFSIRSNVDENFGNMDDVVVVVTMKTGQEHHFAFQLKHKERSYKNLLPGNFEASGSFSLAKYCKAFKDFREEYKKYNLILYTNANFDASRTDEVTIFDMIENDGCIGNAFFNTSGSRDNVYKFAVNKKTPGEKKEDFEEFFPRFLLYTNQKNFKKLKENILAILEFEEVYLKYVEVFRKWHQGEFTNKTIDKKTLNLHLVDIFLSPFAVKNQLSDELFEAAVREFDVTIIEESLTNFSKELVEGQASQYLDLSHRRFQDYVDNFFQKFQIFSTPGSDNNPIEIVDQCLHRLAKEYKFSEKSTTLDEDTKLKILHYFFEKPLILDFGKTSAGLIYKAMELYHQDIQSRIRFVILGLGVDVKKISRFQIFGNLEDLAKINSDLYHNVIAKSSISLQGRLNSSLDKFAKDYGEIVEFITPKELFLMLKRNYSVSGEQKVLGPHYIPRSVSVSLVGVETALDYCKKTRDLLVIDFDGGFENYKDILESRLVKVIEMQNFLEEIQRLQSIDVMAVNGKISRKYFEQICHNYPNRQVHYFKILSENFLMLIMSSKNIFLSRNYQYGKYDLDEDSVHSVCNAPVNILTAQPGMGKSTLLKSLTNRCPPNMWALYIELKTHNSYLKEKHESEDLLIRFMGLEDQDDSFLDKIKRLFLKKRKILFLLDGLDEIENICVDNVLEHVAKLSLMGYRFWLSSRQHLRQKLEDFFNISAMEITELSEGQQKLYVQNRLRSKYEDHEIAEIISKMFVHIANNRQILGVPLQLKIITEILTNDRNYYEKNSNVFVLTKMYRAFFEGRFRHSLEKLESKNTHLAVGELEEMLEDYELAALQSIFNPNAMSVLNLDLRRNRRFLEKLKNRKDPLGIITKVDAENQAVFEHITFAEYFASEFLVNNLDKAKVLQRHLFSEEYQNVFLIFNIMLAEDSNLHLAIIYKDFGQIKRYLEDASRLDKGGRNVLHLVTTHTKRLPHLEVSRLDDLEYINSNYTRFLSEDISQDLIEIFEFLMESRADPFAKDQVFAFDFLEYCLAMGSLHFFERMLKKYGLSADFAAILWKYFDELNVAYYSFKFGYPQLLKLILSKNNFFLHTLIELSSRTFYNTDSVLRLVFLPECANKSEMINLLIDDYKNKQQNDRGGLMGQLMKKLWFKQDTKQATNILELLHFAAGEGDIRVINFLLDEGVNINFANRFRETPLHFAINRKQIGVVTLLVEKGADINARNKDEETSLHLAAKSGNAEMIALLLRYGADLNTKNRVGKSILASAASRGHSDAVNLLLEKGAYYDATILRDAVGGGSIKIIERFLSAGFDINTKDQMDETPLFVAVCLKTTEVMEFLVDKGADVGAVSNRTGTLLHKVLQWADYDEIAMIDALLGNIDINLLYVTDVNGATPLHLAVHKGNVEAVDLLLKKGVDLDRIDIDNRQFPLHAAVKDGHLDASLLLELTKCR